MKIITETSLFNFDAWSGAIDTQKRIINEGKEAEFEQLIEELYPDGVTDVQLNDLLRFGDEWIYDTLENFQSCCSTAATPSSINRNTNIRIY